MKVTTDKQQADLKGANPAPASSLATSDSRVKNTKGVVESPSTAKECPEARYVSGLSLQGDPDRV